MVKCFSHTFPPPITETETNVRKAHIEIIDNCKEHLIQQLNKNRPKLIICNGSNVCWEMIKFFPPENRTDLKFVPSYKTQVELKNGIHEFWIVLSGFIGRIDDRNKRKLGKEIEKIIEWKYFYEDIENFENVYEEGFIYQIKVERKKNNNSNSSQSDYSYRYLETLSKTSTD